MAEKVRIEQFGGKAGDDRDDSALAAAAEPPRRRGRRVEPGRLPRSAGDSTATAW